MLYTGKIVACVLATAGVVFVIGIPWLLNKNGTSDEYVTNAVATTTEVQDFDLMWANLELLQKKAAELGPAQFKIQFLETTTDFLQIDSDQSENFFNVVEKGLDRLDEARLTRIKKQNVEREVDAGILQKNSWSSEHDVSIAARRDAWGKWRDDQRETSDLLLTALQPNSRHHLLAERRLLWLLKLDSSIRAAQK